MSDGNSVAGLIVTTHWALVSPLGETAQESCYAYRAGAVGMRQAGLLDADGQPVTFCTVPTLSPFDSGMARKRQLMDAALLDFLRETGELLRGARVLVYLLVDEEDGSVQQDGSCVAQTLGLELRTRIREVTQMSTGLEIDISGPAGFGQVLTRASQGLSSQQFEYVVVAAVHSDYSPERVAALEQAHRLHSADQLDGLILGEAASINLFCLEQTARALRLPVGAKVLPPQTAQERARPDNDESAFEAAGLTVAARKAADDFSARSGGDAIGWVGSDASLEMFRVHELQTVIVRLGRRLREPQVLELPCHRMGYLGPVVGPFYLIYAAEGYLGEYAPSSAMLCLLGSDAGPRAAFVASAP